MSAPNYAGDLRNAAIGTLLAVDVSENVYWETNIPEDPSARARELAEEARANLAAGGIYVEILGNGAYVDDTPWFYSATLNYSYVIELVGLDPDKFPPNAIVTGVLAVPLALLTGNVSLAWSAAVTVQRVDWIEVVEATGAAAVKGFGFLSGLTANLAVVAIVVGAIWFLPRAK